MSIIPDQIKAIIFDLDDTLYDCSGTLFLKIREHAAKIISKAINCTETEALKLQSKLEEKYGTKADIYRKISNLYKLPDEFYKEISKIINNLDIKDITLFSDVTASVSKLKSTGYKLILVTAGDRNLQERKIKVLGIETVFDEIFITSNSSGKEECFKKILIKYELKPYQALCIGDKIQDEIEIGKNLGMHTALMEHGRHYNSYNLNTNDKVPDMSISKISDLLKN